MESDETCSTGPHNGGVLGDAHVRLTWPASPNATVYRIDRSPDPAALVCDDEGSAANACGAEAP